MNFETGKLQHERLNYNRQVNISIIDAPTSIAAALKYKNDVNFAIVAGTAP